MELSGSIFIREEIVNSDTTVYEAEFEKEFTLTQPLDWDNVYRSEYV
jgi:hypothetical protein